MSFPSTHIDWAVEVAVRLMSNYDVVDEDVGTARMRMPIRKIR